MHRLLAAIGCLVFVAAVHAQPSTDPLRFIPDKANLVIKVEHPAKFLQSIASLEAFKQAERLDAVRKALDTAQARRFFEFIAYYERDLGAKWPDLLDKLAGGGIALSARISGGQDDPLLAVIQSKDEALLAKFVERIIGVFEEELARADSKDKVGRETVASYEVLHFGKDLHLCRIGSTLLISNKFDAIKSGLQSKSNVLSSKSLQQAKKLLPANPQVWLWYDFDYFKSRDDAKEVLTTPRNNTVFTFFAAGYLDVVRRSQFVAAGLYENKDGYSLTIRMPAGRDGMAEDVDLHVPRDPKVAGTLPLLEPDGVIASHSFYLDLGVLWTKRGKIMSEQSAKDFEKGVKDASRFLPGTSIDKLMTQSGVHHRLVAAQRPLTAGYKIEPQVRIPAFAYVGGMRDPAFGKSVEVLIRGGVALLSTQASVKIFEEKHADIPLFGYTFPEDGKFPDDPQGIRFNFTPSYAVVKDQIVVASTREFCKEMIDYVLKEDRSKVESRNMQARGYAEGAAALLNASPEQFLTQTILSQAVSEVEAKKQVDDLLKYLKTLGSLRFETDYTDKNFRFNIDWKFKK